MCGCVLTGCQGADLTYYLNLLHLVSARVCAAPLLLTQHSRQGLVEPVGMQLFMMNIDDPDSARMVRACVCSTSFFTSGFQIGPLNGTNFAPSFLPDDSGIIFSSNMDDPSGGTFQLYTINLDGTNLQRVTDPSIASNVFNAFPMFSPDGTTLMWCSSRLTKVCRGRRVGRRALLTALRTTATSMCGKPSGMVRSAVVCWSIALTLPARAGPGRRLVR